MNTDFDNDEFTNIPCERCGNDIEKESQGMSQGLCSYCFDKWQSLEKE